MKNLKKLVIASFMLVIAFVAVVSSTYAWFTQGKDATVNNIEIGVVDANKSLLIGRENGVWSRNITIKPFGKMTPVTLRSGSVGAEGMFTQLLWDADLNPSFENAKALNEEYVKTEDTAVDNNKTYYTLSVENNVATFTEVQTPNVSNIGSYYEKPQATEKYVKATTWNATGAYYTYDSTNSKYVSVQSPVEGDLTNYYIENPNYIEAGYVKFDLFFQISVNKSDEWATTSIQMDINGLQAFDYNAQGQRTETANASAVSSFRLAITEGNNPSTIAQIVEGAGTNRYGAGPQFALTNGWLGMLNDSAYNASNNVIEKGNESFALQSTYADAASKNFYVAETNESGVKLVDATDGKFEYVMNCGNSCAAQIEQSDDLLTKTFQITVYVWMEGWDGDNVNAAASCEYVFGLSFRAQ